MSGRRGQDYLDGLKGRRIFLSGKLVDDPGQERTTASMAEFLARYLDECRSSSVFADPEGFPWPYALARDPEQVRARGAAFVALARRTGGMMGRSPDFLATVLTGWRAAAAYFGSRADQVVRYWEHAREQNLILTHAISDPPADRFLPDSVRGAMRTLHAVEASADGLVVSGAKMLATLAPFADELLVYPFRPLGKDEASKALCFAVPVNTPGLTLHSRPALNRDASADGALARALDELDAICVFDQVLVPWERVFIDRDVDLANGLRSGTGMTAYAWHQSAARARVKLELVWQLAAKCARVSGRDRQETVRRQLGELAGIAETLRALVTTAEAGAHQDRWGYFVCDSIPLGASGMTNASVYPRAVELLQLIVSSGLILHPSVADESPESPSHDYFRHYFAGVDSDADEHGRLLRLAAELGLDRFGSRQVLYERVFLGPPEQFQAKFYDLYAGEHADFDLLSALLAEAR